MTDKKYYEPPEKSWWQGRYDGSERAQMRWWRAVQLISLDEVNVKKIQHSFVFLGFASDEGVARNKGRVGAKDAPKALRSACCNLPVHFSSQQKIIDAGNIICADKNLEEAQEHLSISASAILKSKGFPVLFGGGHEILYGHYCGVRKIFPEKKIGIINFDAHFDLRSTAETRATSGTGFFQIAEDCKKTKNDFLYFAIGIQETGNTKELFERAKKWNVEYILARDFHFFNLEKIKQRLQSFLDKTDIICLTVDLDVFASADAPGVSAPSATGLRYDFVFCEILKTIAQSNKIVSMDIAELNPKHDIDNRTAKLAANILFDWINLLVR